MLHVPLPEPVPKGITGILALLTVSELWTMTLTLLCHWRRNDQIRTDHQRGV